MSRQDSNRRYNASPKGLARRQKYIATAKGKAALDRSNASEKGEARRARYESSAKGIARRKRRLFIGDRFVGTAASVQEAGAINALIKERLSVFIKGFESGAQAENLPPRGVPPEASPLPD